MTEEKDVEDAFLQSNESDAVLTPFGTWRIWKNVIVLSVAMMTLFTASYGTGSLQSTLNAEAGLGTASLAAGSAGALLSNIFISVLITKWLGTKWAVCFSMFAYIPYIAFQMYPRFFTLVPTMFFTGVGSGPLWCAKCTYLAMAAEAYSAISNASADALLQRFLGFFYMIFQMNQIWGNLISSLVLSSGNNTAAVTSLNATMIPQLCGANFLAQSYAKEALPKQPPEKIQMIAGIYLACVAAAIFIVAVGLDSMKSYECCRKNTENKRSGLALLVLTMKQLANPDLLLLLVITLFLGIQQAFFAADFSASFVSCAVGTGSVGYIMMTFGLSNAVGCFVTGWLVKMIGRVPLFLGALITYSGVLVTLLVWRPHAGDYYVMFIIAVLWGICDSIWTVQINAYFGILFRGEEEAAFSNFRLWQFLGQIISFVLSAYIRTRYKIYILLCSVILGISGYLVVEYRHHREDKKIVKYRNS